MSEYQTIHKQRLDRLARLEERLSKVEQDRRRTTNTLEADWEEQATIRQNDEVLDELAAEERQQAVAIRAALQRMTDGTYGTCRTCGERITTKRLEALPYAVQCIDCATEAEKGKR